jgi:hypothetical protein
MTLSAGFPFTQTALRTYLECPYRFRLRYLEGVPWATLPPEPAAEAVLERGRRFHEVARQHFLGLEVAEQATAAGAEVAAWWAALRGSPPDLAAYRHLYPEAGLSVPLGSYRLAARYDLLAVGQDEALIVDWKTGQDLGSPAALGGDVQTRVYLYVLAEGGAVYHAGRPLAAHAVGLLYWHPRGPQQVRLGYSPSRHAADQAFLEALVREVAARRPEEMLPTDDAAACGHCAYTPLCGRPGGTLEWEPEEAGVAEDVESAWEEGSAS